MLDKISSPRTDKDHRLNNNKKSHTQIKRMALDRDDLYQRLRAFLPKDHQKPYHMMQETKYVSKPVTFSSWKTAFVHSFLILTYSFLDKIKYTKDPFSTKNGHPQVQKTTFDAYIKSGQKANRELINNHNTSKSCEIKLIIVLQPHGYMLMCAPRQ